MNDVTSAKLLVLVEGNRACVKISGRANCASSMDFKTFVNELYQCGCRNFVLDLSDCVLMDSTFLGVLAGLALRINGQNGDSHGRIELHNPCPRISDILENLGVLPLFQVSRGDPIPLDGTRCAVAAPANASRQEATQTCLEAHKTLMDINPDNAARFKDVAKFLAEDLKKSKSGA